MAKAAVFSVCHGGGPMPVLGDPGHANLVKTLKEKVPNVLRLGTVEAPRAIVLVTAHWSEGKPTISNGKKHKLYYDYGGFPSEAYKLKYDAPGSPEVAKEVFNLLESAGLSPQMDEERGWDHGVFIPLLLINPKADIPIVQLSVMTSESPEKHYAMGQALSSLRDSGVAIVGSGMPTFHNLQMLFSGSFRDGGVQSRNAQFSKTLTEAVTTEDAEERRKKFAAWREWVGAKEAHPVGRAEHFLPLIVSAGAAGNGKAGAHADDLMGSQHYSYFWS